MDRFMRWLTKNDTDELLKRAGIDGMWNAVPSLFVIARYSVFISGFSDLDDRSTWVDWERFLKARLENARMPLATLARTIREEIAKLAADYRGESHFPPLGATAIAVNPTRKPSPHSRESSQVPPRFFS
jgi:hypothetical protein